MKSSERKFENVTEPSDTEPTTVPAIAGKTGFIFKDENGKYDYYIEDTKSKKGERSLPMSPEVEECFRTIIKKRKPPKICRKYSVNQS